MDAIFRLFPTNQNLRFVMVTITSNNSCAPGRRMRTQSQLEKIDEDLSLRTFDLIRDAVLPDFRDRVADYLIQYESVLLGENASDPELVRDTAHQLRGYLRGLNTMRVLGMADWEELDRRVVNTWLQQLDKHGLE
ncbi:hypothetical protein C7534_112107 [Pseudomonas sp. OV226]|nr:hypothetical protein C7534_112107 [Pseudomonas sp. OV226]